MLNVLPGAGCAGHDVKTRSARDALDRAQPYQALANLNQQLAVDRSTDVPAKSGDDNALLLLERGAVLQHTRRYQLSSRDWGIADKQIEVLDFSRKGVHDLGRYLFSDDSGPYRAPAYEKLMINTLNMLNYLARGDLEGARIEARRFTVMRTFVTEHEDPSVSVAGLGSYLAGFVFEMSGEFEEAQRYYKDAAAHGYFQNLASESPKSCPHATGCATLLVVVGDGRVPAKVARRLPIGLALTYASAYLGPRDLNLATQGLVTWVNYPEYERRPPLFDVPVAYVDRQSIAWQHQLGLEREVHKVWNAARGAIIASSITRALARAAIGQGAYHAARGGALGLLFSVGSQAALTAADTPDTRSWSILPARFSLSRIQVPAGKHHIETEARGLREQRTLTLKANRWAVVLATALR